MFPFWNLAIAPVLEAARAQRIVEIGALRGDNTDQILERLGPNSELHVIDPVPQFDVHEYERKHGGQYVFHEALSLEVLPTLGAFDAALIDGDHNWHTVINELRMLAAGTDAAGRELPVMILHDVAWPYGRRDLYYAPDDVPPQWRQPHARRGMGIGQSELRPNGGLNAGMENALTEGGPRNGVMTALEDFLSEFDRPTRTVFVPIYFGLAIVVEEAQLDRQPELRQVLDALESAPGRLELLELGEDIRLRAATSQQNVRSRLESELAESRANQLAMLKAVLLNEHYLENELRIEYLADAALRNRHVEPTQVHDPVRHNQTGYAKLARHRLGPSAPRGATSRSFLPFTAMGRLRLDQLETALHSVADSSVAGDLVECGTGRGGGGIFMRAFLDVHKLTDRDVWVVDRFRSSADGETSPTIPAHGIAGMAPDLNLVRDGFDRFGVLDERVHFLQGPVTSTLGDHPITEIAVLRIGWGVGNATKVLERLYDLVVPGGWVIVDEQDANGAYVGQVEAFRTEHGIAETLHRVDDGCFAWQKSDARVATAPATTEPLPEISEHAPLSAAEPADSVDLTVVVVFYNMRREAKRTLHALSRSYQEKMQDRTYEVIAIENGSADDQKLGAKFVEQFGPEFHYIDLGDRARPSPVTALNHGVALGRGRAFALMIDGAHVLTPGVLHFGLAGLETYAPAIVATQQWYVGPGQQSEAMDNGYDQDYEDRLFESIRWPNAGHQLFEIGHFVGDRDWLDGMWESNCMFVSRKQLSQVGAFDESFAIAGGGYANLELYERLGSSPDITVVSILGEGSFHQTHGGTTTNQPDPVERRSRIFSYSEQYAELRGRAFRGAGKPIHYVGRLPNGASKRSKARRMSTAAFAESAAAGHTDGRPDGPTPVPDELRWSFTESVWRSLPWRDTTWMGQPIESAPTDLHAYQEILATVGPDWVVETGGGNGSRALFLASMCELLGHGQVISVGEPPPEGARTSHPRLRYIDGPAHDSEVADQVKALVGADETAVVILGTAADRATVATEFKWYSPLIGVGSYAIVTDTIVNGHPVWPAYGPGPAEAVKQILTTHGNFVPDARMEKYSLSFNPGGYLKRVR
jgi:cephalosporin hydroxylase